MNVSSKRVIDVSCRHFMPYFGGDWPGLAGAATGWPAPAGIC